MFYVVQENVFREENYNTLIDALEHLGLDYDVVRVLPFVEKIVKLGDDPEAEYRQERRDVFVFGSLKMARISRDRGWVPGSLMTENHDFKVYREHYREELLNWDSAVYRFGDDFPMDRPFFARPVLDSKVFTGGVFDHQTWCEFRERARNNGHSTQLDESTEIQVSSVKQVQKEFRFWVVDGRVITGSLYKLGRRAVTSEVVDDEAWEYAQRMVDKFALAPAFVIDVCLADGQWKIVECGTINCAGFYKANLGKVLMALEDLYK
jgi:hypothetical protein